MMQRSIHDRAQQCRPSTVSGNRYSIPSPALTSSVCGTVTPAETGAVGGCRR